MWKKLYEDQCQERLKLLNRYLYYIKTLASRIWSPNSRIPINLNRLWKRGDKEINNNNYNPNSKTKNHKFY